MSLETGSCPSMKNHVLTSTLSAVLAASCTLVDNPNLAGAIGSDVSTGAPGSTGPGTSTGTSSEQDSGTSSTSTGGEQGSGTTLGLTSTDTLGTSESSDSSSTTDGVTCRDGMHNGDETDVDCGGQCGATCIPGATCSMGTDCLSGGCVAGVCNDALAVMASPACSDYDGITPAPLVAVATGGTNIHAYAWTPDDGSLSDPDMAMTDASPAGAQLYTVTVDDGLTTAQDDVQVVNTVPLALENDCTLYTTFGGMGVLPAFGYDMTGTVACSTNNGDFALGVCSAVYQNARLVGRLEVTSADSDDDMIGLAWGIQPNLSSFYSLSWKAGAQNLFGCIVPGGMLVKRIDAPMLTDLVFADVYCASDTGSSTLLLDPTDTTTEGWQEGESYTVTIDFTDGGSMVTVVRDGDMTQIAAFVVPDATFTSGSLGWSSFSQINACTGPLGAACL